MNRVTILQICDYAGKSAIGLNYQNGSINQVLKDIDEQSIIGDRITLQFTLDTVSKTEIRNILAILDLFNSHQNYVK